MMRLVFWAGLIVIPGLLAGCGGGGGSSNSTPKLRPFADNLLAVTSPGTPVTGQLYASSPDNQPISYEIQTKPSDGTVSLASGGSYTYTPDSGFQGSDTFTFQAKTSNGTSDAATATIVVNGQPPQVSAFGAPVYVTAGGPAKATVKVRLRNPPNGQATVDYTTVDGTAKAGTDYTATSGTLTFGPGTMSQTVTVPLSDTVEQGYRYFRVRLANPSSNVQLAADSAVVLLRYRPEPLNDTATTGCGNDTNGNPLNPQTCPQSGFPQQDGDLGRDRANYEGTLAKVGNGEFGYDFTRLGHDGQPLFNQQANFNTDPWSCVRDNWTGLEWEVPTPVANAGLFDTSYVYTWYNPDSSTNGGSAGDQGGGPNKMDTHQFVQAANQFGLCGHSDWRLPSAAELRNLVNMAASALGSSSAQISPIPTLEPYGYWTSTPDPQHPGRAVVISMSYGYDSFLPKDGGASPSGGAYVILVRGGGN